MKYLLLFLLFPYLSFGVDNNTKAPDFELMNQLDKKISLNSFKGKIVVLEWLNHGCPFVRKHYDSNNMQSLQEKWTKRGIVWLSVISSAQGKQGFVDTKTAAVEAKNYKSNASHILLDPTGTVGKLYDAKTTPHMYIIDQNGLLVFQGAIDSIPSTDQNDIKTAKNYIDEGLSSLLAGQKIAVDQPKAYGCSVKY